MEKGINEQVNNRLKNGGRKIKSLYWKIPMKGFKKEKVNWRTLITQDEILRSITDASKCIK